MNFKDDCPLNSLFFSNFSATTKKHAFLFENGIYRIRKLNRNNSDKKGVILFSVRQKIGMKFETLLLLKIFVECTFSLIVYFCKRHFSETLKKRAPSVKTLGFLTKILNFPTKSCYLLNFLIRSWKVLLFPKILEFFDKNLAKKSGT